MPATPKATEIAPPMPVAPPVTSATRSLRSSNMAALSGSHVRGVNESLGAVLARHQPAVEMPGGVAQHRHYDHQADGERDRAQDQAAGHDQPPRSDRTRIGARGLDRGQDRRA